MEKHIKNIVKKTVKKYLEKQRKKNFFFKQKNTFGLSHSEIVKANKLGFTADEYVIYDLKHNNPSDYISEYERDVFRNYARDYRILLDNKIVFYCIIRNFADTNTIYSYKVNSNYVAFEKGFDKDCILEQLCKKGKIVYKQLNLGGGIGFRLLTYQDGRYSINRKETTISDINSLLNTDNYLLEEYCEQGQFENNFWPYSVNTIRIITLVKEGNVIITNAIQRIGIDKEKCVDNASEGGLYAVIDVETGRLNAARSHTKENYLNYNGEIINYPVHPITQAPIKNIVVPGWQELKVSIISLHKKILFTNILFIAWDIALLDSGYKIIEANTSVGLDLVQSDNEGVRNKSIGCWMKDNGYIV